MSRLWMWGLAALVLTAPVDMAMGQGRGRFKAEKGEKGDKAQKKETQELGKDNDRRAKLERRFRERGDQIVRQRLELNDGQMQRLREVNSRLETRRRTLLQQERETQLALRSELARGRGADQSRVAELMQRTRGMRQQRFDLQQDEQRDLSKFLSPVQQARYFGLQQQLRKRARELKGEENTP